MMAFVVYMIIFWAKPAIKHMGLLGALRLRHHLAFVWLPLWLGGFVFSAFPFTVAACASQSVYWLWAIDDWLYNDDDAPRKKRSWGKVKLKMPKPVKLRPVES